MRVMDYYTFLWIRNWGGNGNELGWQKTVVFIIPSRVNLIHRVHKGERLDRRNRFQIRPFSYEKAEKLININLLCWRLKLRLIIEKWKTCEMSLYYLPGFPEYLLVPAGRPNWPFVLGSSKCNKPRKLKIIKMRF